MHAFTCKGMLLFHSNSLILRTISTCTQQVSIFKLKSKAQMVADGYKGLRAKQRTG